MFSWFRESDVAVAIEWTIRLAMLVIVPSRRTPEAARSWLLLIFFLPIPGLILFLLIGSPRFPAWRVDRFRKMRSWFDELRDRLHTSGVLVEPGNEVTALAEKLGFLPAVEGNTMELIDDYDSVIDRLVADIDGAKKHVRILSYIFADDRTGMLVIDALGRAVDRGVDCHVILDAVGSHHWARAT